LIGIQAWNPVLGRVNLMTSKNSLRRKIPLEVLKTLDLLIMYLAFFLGTMAVYRQHGEMPLQSFLSIQFFMEPALKRRKVNRRLNEDRQKYFHEVQIFKEKSRESTGRWNSILKKVLGEARLAKLRSHLLQADLHHSPTIFIIWSFGLGLLGLLAGSWMIKNSSLGLLGGILGILPHLYVRRKRGIKTKQFEAQMPDSMELLARSLRAGHTLPGAIELLGEEMPDPMGKEMAVTYEEQQFGISTAEALIHMLERINSMDLQYFVGAVLIQQDTGGNLAELMENIAKVIRSRLNFKSKVRGLTAMGRISTSVMIIVPVAAFFILMLVARDYEKVLIEDPTGRTMLMAGLVFTLIGTYLLKKMIKAVES
jgi:tight adherence protein B